ncbi:DUF814 domain-containing protein [Candidatus Woesearchaeota archaeon]|nr:DUF814 domain-containing protein [Candidatus Woesearchaeota archaeon]
MVELTLSLKKSLEENASTYFDAAKKVKKKIEGAKRTIGVYEKKLAELEQKEDLRQAKEQSQIKAPMKKEWYEKFRWFISSEGFLCIGGRDATSNEVLVKKHMVADDLVFHTDMAGSPFFLVKGEGKVPGKITLEEVAVATASYSRAWKNGLKTLETFYVKPEQVSKQAKAGEYMSKGSFMITGKTTYLKPDIGLAIGITAEGRIMAGPEAAIKAHTEKYLRLAQGDLKSSDVAKKIKRQLGGGDLDTIIRALPAGGCMIEKRS